MQHYGAAAALLFIQFVSYCNASVSGPPVIERVAVVTGAAQGIGREIFLNFVKQGMGGVVCIDITAESCRGTLTTAQQVIETYNTTHHGLYGYEAPTVTLAAYGADVSDYQNVLRVSKKVLKEFGKVDVLVNNAGITRDKSLLRMSDSDWTKVINTNLDSVFYVTRSFIRGMYSQGWGRIINVASIVGVRGNAGQSNYAASKAGVIGFTKALAKEVASKNIMVNAVAPGFISSAMTAAMPAAAQSAVLARNPLNRVGLPAEVAAMVGFLASNAASYVSGSVYPVDGLQSI